MLCMQSASLLLRKVLPSKLQLPLHQCNLSDERKETQGNDKEKHITRYHLEVKEIYLAAF